MRKIDLHQSIAVLANLGVVLGIVFLATELRQNTIAVRSEASQGIQSQISDIYGMITNDRMAAVYLTGANDPDQLDPVERVMFNAYVSNILNGFENVFSLMNDGSYDRSRARGYWQLLRNALELPGIQRHWEETRYIYNDAFRSHVENEVMTLDPQPGTAIISASE